MRNKSLAMVFLFSLAAVMFSCSPQMDARSDETGANTVTVSVLPEKYFVERISGDLVHVNVMIGPGDSPHSYEPKPSQMSALSQSVVYFSIGVEFEDAWMERIISANPNMPIVDLSDGLDQIESLDIQHNDGKNHDDEIDPHIWTSPNNVAQMAIKITETLIQIYPEYTDTFRENLDEFLADITSLQNDIYSTLEAVDTRKFMVFHPAWGYFANEFDLQQIPIEVGGNEPSAAELATVIEQAQEENISVIFAQPEFSTRSADTIAEEIGGKVILISPLAEDWLGNLRIVAKVFAEEL